jgi:hypothetical protein
MESLLELSLEWTYGMAIRAKIVAVSWAILGLGALILLIVFCVRQSVD